MSPVTVKLFNGSITLPLPSTFKSAASFCPVPSHQEVFLDTINVNTSIIVEIVERLDYDVPLDNKAKEAKGAVDSAEKAKEKTPAVQTKAAAPSAFNVTGSDSIVRSAVMHFEALADDNDADTFDIDSQYHLVEREEGAAEKENDQLVITKQAIKGSQYIWKQNAMQKVCIWLGVATIPLFDADIVLTLNSGDEHVKKEALETAFEEAFKGLKVLDQSLFVGVLTEEVEEH